MSTENKKAEFEYSSEMQEVFYVEELEDRFEMAALARPNYTCWEL